MTVLNSGEYLIEEEEFSKISTLFLGTWQDWVHFLILLDLEAI